MANLVRINHNRRLVAVVIAGYAIIEDTLPDKDYPYIKAMCLYALELEQQGRLREYSDADAIAYATAALSRNLPPGMQA